MNDDRDFGPTIEGGARRDPMVSIRRQHLEPRQPRARREIPTGWASHLLFAVLAVALVAGGLLLLGILLHIVWDAIMAGWNWWNLT